MKVCADPNNLPYSNSALNGFENKIVRLVTNSLHRPLEFVWRAERRGFLRDGLNAGECDLVAAILPRACSRASSGYKVPLASPAAFIRS